MLWQPGTREERAPSTLLVDAAAVVIVVVVVCLSVCELFLMYCMLCWCVLCAGLVRVVSLGMLLVVVFALGKDWVLDTATLLWSCF